MFVENWVSARCVSPAIGWARTDGEVRSAPVR